MKCAECKACDHELCTINITPYILKKSKRLGCALNHIQVEYYRKLLAHDGRTILNLLDNKTFSQFFKDGICDYIQCTDKYWCEDQKTCFHCIDKWLTETHLT